ncbi:MAG: ActS/PrrB/RegB family redox-sensitive histidine kinase [Caulobacter sp.]|jgi:two-component system sensor histidine kinase RegB
MTTTAPQDPFMESAIRRALDRPADIAAQDAGLWTLGGARRARLRIRTLITIRWLAVAGQLVTVLFVHYGLGFDLPLIPCLVLIAVSAFLNLLVLLADNRQRQMADWEATVQLGFDILQLSGMLYLTGGTINPFSVLLIAPVVLAAATLPFRQVVALGLLAIGCTVVLSMNAMPLPAATAAPLNIPLANRVGNVLSRVLGIAFCAGYAWQAASEAARMELALDTTNAVLAREQRLSALGGLAAAAAHELGTPLATISIVAKELALTAPPGPIKEDADLLVSQAERCREILRRLTADPNAADEMHARVGLAQLLEDVIAPYARDPDVRIEAVVSGPRGAEAPDLRRLPEVQHAMASFVENATDFAAGEVLLKAGFDERHITIEVRDDGPGFSQDILAKLGEPYVTSRPGAEGSRTGHIGMGLGFFIAKTLLERTGAKVSFSNARGGGAVVTARWPRQAIEA